MTNYKLDNELKLISAYIYPDNKNSLPSGWKLLDKKSNLSNGFYAEALYKNDEIVIVYRGTDLSSGGKELSKDFILSDALMGHGQYPSQANDARKFLKEIQEKHPKAKITLSGHSLGGSLAQIIGSETGINTVTFGAYGTLLIQDYTPKYTKNIVNYGSDEDPIFTNSIDYQIGETRIVSSSAQNSDFVGKTSSLNKGITMYEGHKIENLGELEKSKVYIGNNDTNLNESTVTLKGQINYDEYNDSRKMPDIYDYKSGKMIPRDEYLTNPIYSWASSDSNEVPVNNLTPSQQMDNWIRSQAYRSRDRVRELEERLSEQPKAEDFSVSSEIDKYANSDSEVKSDSSDKTEKLNFDFDEKKFEKGYTNEVSDSNRIYTVEDINEMSDEEYEKNHEAIVYQSKAIGIPTEEKAKEIAASGGMVYVKGYERPSDGASVKSHYRARPSR